MPRRYKKKNFVKWDKKELEELYINQNLSARKIAQKLDTTPQTVWKYLRKFGVKRDND